MVQAGSRRAKRWAYFALFVLPALFLYSLFFIYPFIQGILISFTNWDGLTPKTPISLPRAEFETRILDKVQNAQDREFLLGIYRLDDSDGMYKRYSITGLARYRLQRVLRSIKYEPDTYRYVGLDNYKQIFTGGVEERFYPRLITKINFNESSSLPASIPKGEYEGVFLPNVKTDAERRLAGEFYSAEGGQYVLKPEFDEFALEDRIWLLPEVEVKKTIEPGAVDGFITRVKEAGLKPDQAASRKAVDAFLSAHTLSDKSAAEVRDASDKIFGLGAMKKLLAAGWVQRQFEMGVVGFTLFFTLFNVVGSNLLAFFIAMALDAKLKTRNVLRSVFFLPNVISMVVVALVWSFVFYNLLPAITGIDKWMGDPAKAPWLIVLVQVWQQTGYLMVIYLAGMSNIPTDVLEAASIDGARFRARLRHITLPLLIPAFTICLFLSISNSLKCFDLVYAMVGPSGYATGTVPIVMDIFFDAFAKKLAGLATAKAILLFILIFLITGAQLTITKRKEVQL